MARNNFHVVPYSGDWQLKYEGQVLGTHSLKTDAVASGRATAKKYQPSELFIHNSDGTIAQRETYGNDPYPPRG